MIYIYPCKNKKEMGVSAKTAIKQVANSGRYKKEAWQYRELGSTHGIVLGFLRGRGRSLAFIAKWQWAWVTVWIKEVFLGDRGS